jgi:hypothetical protein
VTFRQIYGPFVKTELESNQIVSVLPFYDTFEKVKNNLLKSKINVDGFLAEGSLLIIDSREAFFNQEEDDSENKEKGNVVSLMRIVQAQARKLQKDGITILVDLGCFFPFAGIGRLLKYEKSIPQIFKDTSLKQLCVYHQRDFDVRLNASEKADLLDEHRRSIIMMDN